MKKVKNIELLFFVYSNLFFKLNNKYENMKNKNKTYGIKYLLMNL